MTPTTSSTTKIRRTASPSPIGAPIPNTGEVRGASVYYNSIWLTDADTLFENDFAGKLPQRVRKAMPAVRWKPMLANHLCTLEAPSFRAGYVADALPAALTKKQKVEQFLTHIALHEIGHILGLRHNFKGSLVPPSTSCMDYLDDPAPSRVRIPARTTSARCATSTGSTRTSPKIRFAPTRSWSSTPTATPSTSRPIRSKGITTRATWRP